MYMDRNKLYFPQSAALVLFSEVIVYFLYKTGRLSNRKKTVSVICCCLYCLNLLIKQIFFLKTENCKVPGLSDGLQLPTHEPGDQLRTGEKLTFTCRRRGDFVRGKAEVECLAGGRWSDPFPTCGGKSILFFSPCSLSRKMMGIGGQGTKV